MYLLLSRPCLTQHRVVGQSLYQRTRKYSLLLTGIALSVIFLLIVSNTALGQVIVERDSYLNFNDTFGAGGTSLSDNQTLYPT
jgi:hypothetical protein